MWWNKFIHTQIILYFVYHYIIYYIIYNDIIEEHTFDLMKGLAVYGELKNVVFSGYNAFSLPEVVYSIHTTG